MKAKVVITLKPGLLDAQGKTVKGALDSLGFKGVNEVRIGKYVELDLQGLSPAAAKAAVERMCKKLLANPIIETYRVEVAKQPINRSVRPVRPFRLSVETRRRK